jgi:hypothetical protein
MPDDTNTSDSITLQFSALTVALLDSGHAGQMQEAAVGLHSLLSGIAGLKEDAPTASDNAYTVLPDGKAISPRDAARCVCDFARTAKFVRGLEAALAMARERFPGDTLEVLYAGCGPFATLVTLLAGRFPQGTTRITLLDVHQQSLDSAAHVLRTLGLEAALGECVLADAATYVPSRAPHVIVAETMQRALEHEPQVAITMNLARHVRAGGFFIPERITVDACLYDQAREFSLRPEELAAVAGADSLGRVRIMLGRLMDLTADSTRTMRAIADEASPGNAPRLPPVRIALPAGPAAGLQLALFTGVNVFGSIRLGDYESGITYPAEVRVESDADGGVIEFSYRMGSRPRFEHLRLS